MRRNRVVVGVVVVGLVVLALGAVAWGVSNGNDADQARAALAQASGDLTSTKVSLSAAQTDLMSAQAVNTRIVGENQTLAGQVEAQSACLADLQSIQEDLASHIAKQRSKFNATAEGSKMASASTSDRKSLVAAIDDYYNAYSAAYDGRYSAANSWISKGNAHIEAANAALKKFNAEVAIVDKTTKQLESELAALEGRTASAAVTCAATP